MVLFSGLLRGKKDRLKWLIYSYSLPNIYDRAIVGKDGSKYLENNCFKKNTPIYYEALAEGYNDQ